jgi:hypothetical protein
MTHGGVVNHRYNQSEFRQDAVHSLEILGIGAAIATGLGLAIVGVFQPEVLPILSVLG